MQPDAPLAHSSRTPIDRRAALRIATTEGVWASVCGVLTMGVFLTGYVLHLGANDLQLGIVMSIPVLAQTMQLPGAWWVERTGHRKLIASLPALLSRLLWLPIAFLPFLPLSSPLMVFIILFALSNLLIQLAIPAWTVWMSDLVPLQIRGRYFATRNRLLGAVTLMVSLVAGVAIDVFRDREFESGGYALLFGTATVAGILAYWTILRQPEPGYLPHERVPLRRYVQHALGGADQRRMVVFHVYWLFAIGISAPFYPAYLIKVAAWSYKHMVVLGILFTISSLVCQPVWGRAVDRYGHKPVIRVCTCGILFLPLFYVFGPPRITWPIYANAILAGIFWSGFGLAVFNLLMATAPEKSRAGFVAFFSSVSGCSMFVAQIVGGKLALWIGAAFAAGTPTWLPDGFSHYQVLFFLSSLLRCPALLLLNRIQESRALHTVVMVREAFAFIDRNFALGRTLFGFPARFRRND